MLWICLAYARSIDFTSSIFALKRPYFSINYFYYPLKYCLCILYKVGCAIVYTLYMYYSVGCIRVAYA